MSLRKVAVIGSSTFPIGAEVGAEVVDVIRGLGEDVVLLTRGRGDFDRFIMGVAPILGIRCFAFPSKGGSDNWQRDVDLVVDADEVLAFFDPATLHDEKTGTAHVVERALDKRKPVRAFTVADRHLVYAGES